MHAHLPPLAATGFALGRRLVLNTPQCKRLHRCKQRGRNSPFNTGPRCTVAMEADALALVLDGPPQRAAPVPTLRLGSPQVGGGGLIAGGRRLRGVLRSANRGTVRCQNRLRANDQHALDSGKGDPVPGVLARNRGTPMTARHTACNNAATRLPAWR